MTTDPDTQLIVAGRSEDDDGPADATALAPPVRVEGTLRGDTFHSDTILVRHDATYDEENHDRVREAEKDAVTTTAPGGPAAQDVTETGPGGPALGGASG